MLKIIVLVCFLAAVLASLLLTSWLRTRRGHGERAARLILALRNRNAEFRNFQIPVILIAIVLLLVVVGMGRDWFNAAAFAIGAVLSFVVIIFASSLMVSGASAAANSADQNDISQSVRAAYRSGLALGFIHVSAGIMMLSALFLNVSDFELIDYTVSLALGVSVTATFINSGGAVYSSAYAMASSDKDFTDVSGFFYGYGADLLESYIIAGASAIMLAELAVVTSGITSTFTVDEAAKYPVVIYAVGIGASIIGSLFYRAGSLRRPSGSGIIAMLVAGIITGGLSFYFSDMMLQSLVYGYAVSCGIAAGLIMGAISKIYASGSKLMVSNSQNDRKLGKHAHLLFNLGNGMTSSFFFAIIMAAALAVSFNFASYYGIALCAVGFCSIIALTAGYSGLNILSGCASDILSSEYLRTEDEADNQRRNDLADKLSTASAATGSSSKTFVTSAAFLSAMGMIAAIFYVSEAGSLAIVSEKSISVLLSVAGGAASVLFLFGIVLNSVRITGTVALRNIQKSDEEGASSSLRGSMIPPILAIAFPSIIGLFFGFRILFVFLVSAVFTGYLIVNTVNNSGRYFENTAASSLNSLIKLMVVFSAVFTSVIINIGGFIH